MAARHVILFLHNRYRTTGGEERALDDLLWLVHEKLGEETALLTRDSAALGRGQAAAGLLRGGLQPAEVASAVRRTGARIVHAHNLNPSLGWRALAAARDAGARTVLHLHNYRLVCAVGTCFTRGADCTRCHGRNTAPGVRRNCRGTGAEAAVYGASLALWQRRMLEHADAVIVPSAFALERLRAMGAPLERTSVHIVGHMVRDAVEHSTAADGGYALVVSRLAREKGIDVAIDACAAVGLPLVIAGEGPERASLWARATGTQTVFEGRVDDDRLRALRAAAGPGDRALALGGDVRSRRGRGDGRRAAGRGQRDRRAARAVRPGRARRARRRGRARRRRGRALPRRGVR